MIFCCFSLFLSILLLLCFLNDMRNLLAIVISLEYRLNFEIMRLSIILFSLTFFMDFNLIMLYYMGILNLEDKAKEVWQLIRKFS